MRIHIAQTTLVAVSVMVWACSQPESGRPHIEQSPQSLENNLRPADVLGFEVAQAWTPVRGAPTLALDSAIKTEGDAALAVTMRGYSMVQSVAFTNEELDLDYSGATLAYDIRYPALPPNPAWFGKTQLYLDAPSAGIHSAPLEPSESVIATPETFQSVSFRIPEEVAALLSQGYTDLRFQISLNVPRATAAVHLDNLRLLLTCASSSQELPVAKLCDRVLDCAAGEDEAECETFTCNDGAVMHISHRCDGVRDCADYSDEYGCPGGFSCADGSLTIPQDQHCDLVTQCADGSDEQNCDLFECAAGGSVLERLRCDGIADCPDGSDEAGCGSLSCDNGRTVPTAYQCDGIDNCLDGTDERNCAGFVNCADGHKGVPQNRVCDGTRNCADGSDERACAGFKSCADGSMTVPYARWCDGFANCSDGSDEAAPGCLQNTF